MDGQPVTRARISEQYLQYVYGHGHYRPQPARARALRRQNPWLGKQHPWAEGRLSAQAPDWGMHLLIALTHSSLSGGAQKTFLHSIQAVLAAGADANQSWRDPSSGHPLSALYGAAGKNHQPLIVELLLQHGANPNDNESLYHSVANLECVKRLLAAGATTKGTNALARSLDPPHGLAVTRALLEAGADPAEGPGGGALFWAIRRRRSLDHVKLLLQHGAGPHAKFHGITTYQAALWMGLPGVAAHLRRITNANPLTGRDAFLAACGCADQYQARLELKRSPDLIRQLPLDLLALLPLQAETGNNKAVRLMVKLGWPIAAKGGDWRATALNLAVFRGDAKLTRFLLAHGASWQETHGYGSNARGTLAYASRDQPVKGGDWKGCEQALLESGMPAD